MRSRPEQLGDTFDQCRQLKIAFFQRQLLGFKFGEIQHIVNDIQQRPARVANRIGMALLFGRQFGVQ